MNTIFSQKTELSESYKKAVNYQSR